MMTGFFSIIVINFSKVASCSTDKSSLILSNDSCNWIFRQDHLKAFFLTRFNFPFLWWSNKVREEALGTYKPYIYIYTNLAFTPCIVALWGMELQDKKHKKNKAYRHLFKKNLQLALWLPQVTGDPRIFGQSCDSTIVSFVLRFFPLLWYSIIYWYV